MPPNWLFWDTKCSNFPGPNLTANNVDFVWPDLIANNVDFVCPFCSDKSLLDHTLWRHGQLGRYVFRIGGLVPTLGGQGQ